MFFIAILLGALALAFWSADYSCEATVDLVEGVFKKRVAHNVFIVEQFIKCFLFYALL